MSSIPAILALENGVTMNGYAIGAIGAPCAGEVVFNTAMSGYQEVLTDPSYKGQIITFTYPHIGNYGVNVEDIESDGVKAAGLIVHELSRVASNYRSTMTLDEYLRKNNIAGIEGVDTRALVRIIRSEGAMRCVIAHGHNLDPAALVEQARNLPSMNGLDLVPEVTTKERYEFVGGEGTAETEDWYVQSEVQPSTAPNTYHVVAIDFGMKQNILRRLAAHGCRVTVVPATTPAEEILSIDPDGVFLSNGPGDPAAVTYGIETTKKLLGKKPMFGICLGHQIMSLAVGANTYKMKFGHRGANHPVKNMLTGRIEITSQNHGFAVDPASLPPNAEMTHVNLNDNTCAGIRLVEDRAFAVQYHPEASPGPHDSDYLFRDFVQLMGAQ